MRFDANGLQLADVPNAGGVSISRTGRANNKRHDNRSGKFTTGQKTSPKQTTAPANTDPLEFSRMLDAARDAARELDSWDEDDIRSFIQDRANSPDNVDIAAFMKQVDEQRKTDVVDLITQKIGSKKNKIKISASAATLKGLMRGLDTEALNEVYTRLEAKGFKRSEITSNLGASGKADEVARRQKDVSTSDNRWQGETSFFEAIEVAVPSDAVFTQAQIVEMFGQIPQPVINVAVEIPKGTKKVKRNPETGLVESIEEE